MRKAEAMIARGDNPDLTVEDVVTEVPGVCFTRLMDIIPAQVLEGMTWSYEGHRSRSHRHKKGSIVKNITLFLKHL